MPHESTVDHEDVLQAEAAGLAPRAREIREDSPDERRKRLERSSSILPNLYAPTPRQFTQILDDDSPDSTETESCDVK
jgi:hypothetical protein